MLPAATPWLADTDTWSADVGHGGGPGGADREGPVAGVSPGLMTRVDTAPGCAAVVPGGAAVVPGGAALPQAATRAAAPIRPAAAVRARAARASSVVAVAVVAVGTPGRI